MRNLFVVLLLSVIATTAFGAEIVLDRQSRNATGIAITSDDLMTRANPAIVLECVIDRIAVDVVETPSGAFTTLVIPQFQQSETIGAPALPVMNKIVQIPVGSNPHIKVLDYTSTVYTYQELGLTAPVYPRQPSFSKSETEFPFVYEPAAYMFRGFMGDDIATIEKIGMMRHMELAYLNINPVEYDPVDQKIKVYNDIKIRIDFDAVDLLSNKEMTDRFYSPAFSAVEDMIMTPDSLKYSGDATRAKMGYAIVAHQMFKDALKPFIEWKTKKGFQVTVAYMDEIGGNAAGIESYMKNLYKTAAIAPSFLLMVGDNEQAPAMRGKTGSHVTDLYYTTMTPGDIIPDIFHGRFPAATVKQLENMIEKTIRYERFDIADPSYLKDVVLMAGWDSRFYRSHGWPQVRYSTENYFNAEHGFRNVNAYLVEHSQYKTAEIREKISAGVAIASYTAHGSNTSWADPAFTIPNINAMTNEDKYILAIGNCCITNRFDIPECFGEAWLRAEKKGAIGYIGASNSTYWDEDLWWGLGNYPIVSYNPEGLAPKKEETGIGAYDKTFNTPGLTNSQMMLSGLVAVQESTSPRKNYYWEVYHLMGDPALATYINTPGTFKSNNPETIASHAKTLDINAPAGSMIGISQNGLLVGSGFAGKDDKAQIQLSNMPKSGSLDLVISGLNMVPTITTIEITE